MSSLTLFFAYAGSVDQIEVKSKLVIARIDGVAGGSGYIGDDVAVLAYEGVDY